jgi:predicted RNA-binding protein associated with RNAse of E/G family
VSDRVRIHYRRLPDHEEVFDQRIVLERDDVIVTVTGPLDLPKPVRADREILLEAGARAVWLTFPGASHDIGRFHLRDGTFTGYYGNILTPVEMTPPRGGEPHVWHTTDLFLDVWLPAGGEAALLDEDELEAALAEGHIDAHLARGARAEADRLLWLAAAGAWPPPVAWEWTLERVEAEERLGGR